MKISEDKVKLWIDLEKLTKEELKEIIKILSQ